MNLYLVDVIIKFIRILFVMFISLFNYNGYNENLENLENNLITVDSYAVNNINDSEIIINNDEIKSKSLISNKKTVIKKIQVNDKKDKKIITTEKSATSLGEYKGRLTGYGPDCLGCTGTGNLACRTREKKTFSLVRDGIYYTDSEYGKIRILSAATAKFKCGTIVVVTKSGGTPFTAIVLDTGGDMRRAWNNGTVWMDLAYSSASMASSDGLTGKNINFSVQRWGW